MCTRIPKWFVYNLELDLLSNKKLFKLIIWDSSHKTAFVFVSIKFLTFLYQKV